MSEQRRIRVLLAKPGLDGHDRGLKVMASFLRDVGMEIVYLGLFQPVENIVDSAVQEDVDIIGLSTLDGGHVPIAEDIMKLLGERGINIPVVMGGIIPDEDIPILNHIGVREVFGPGTPIKKITESLQRLASSNRH